MHLDAEPLIDKMFLSDPEPKDPNGELASIQSYLKNLKNDPLSMEVLRSKGNGSG
jgi:hypothetical protein